MNTTQIKPWFLDTILPVVSSIYFAGYENRKSNLDYWRGFITFASALTLAVGGNPESFLTPEDIQMLKSRK